MTKHRRHGDDPGHGQEGANDPAGCTPPDAIAHRAYELFQERGREPGRDLDDWLRAEQEVTQSKDPSQSE